MENRGCDLLCVSPHTDDAEIGLGATLRLLADRGRRVWVCDLTRGELGSNGTPDERWAEAAGASARLGLTGRLQLGLPDGFISVADPAQVAAVTAVLRRLRPRWVVSAPAPLRHPDHLATPALVAKAAFLSRLAAYDPPFPVARWWPAEEPGAGGAAAGAAVARPGSAMPAPPGPGPAGAPWRPEAVFEVCPPGQTPTVVFDVTATWEAKREALACYRSQFDAAGGRRPTMINDRSFLAEVERWALRWGHLAGVGYGEALRGAAAPVLGDLPAERWA